ncbi:MAG TPA: DinB family protein [Candidatus Dormibacteraeota bacterium]
MSDEIFDQLLNSQQLVSTMLRISAEDSSARVGAWDLRDIAAHLAATERDCYVPRIRAIAAGESPKFDFFTNDGTDFSGTQLEAALDEWSATRERLIDFVRSLDGAQRTLTGQHERYGAVTVDRYLEIALEHDRDHLRSLERLAGEAR